MDKKDNILNTEKQEESFEKEIIFEKEPVAVVKEEKPKKEPYIILNIMYGDFILNDKNGNGIRTPIPKEYKDKKIGETIYL